MNASEKLSPRPSHNVIMENRRMLSLSGVRDVESFSEQAVTLSTELGGLTVRGLELHISRFDQDSGELAIDGEINELVYADIEPERKGFFSRLLG